MPAHVISPAEEKHPAPGWAIFVGAAGAYWPGCLVSAAIIAPPMLDILWILSSRRARTGACRCAWFACRPRNLRESGRCRLAAGSGACHGGLLFVSRGAARIQIVQPEHAAVVRRIAGHMRRNVNRCLPLTRAYFVALLRQKPIGSGRMHAKWKRRNITSKNRARASNKAQARTSIFPSRVERKQISAFRVRCAGSCSQERCRW